jgi:hypothetical protein
MELYNPPICLHCVDSKSTFLPTWPLIISFRLRQIYRGCKEFQMQLDKRRWRPEIPLPPPPGPPGRHWVSCTVVKWDQPELVPSASVGSDVSSPSLVGRGGSAGSRGKASVGAVKCASVVRVVLWFNAVRASNREDIARERDSHLGRVSSVNSANQDAGRRSRLDAHTMTCAYNWRVGNESRPKFYSE